MSRTDEEIKRYETKMKSCTTMTDLLVAMSSWQSYAQSHNLSTEEKRELAESLFRQMGGGVLLDSQESPLVGFQKMAADFQSKGIFSESYVAYGYTNGIDRVRKVNGKSINLTVAMNYDEEKGITHVVMGSPLVNSDF